MTTTICSKTACTPALSVNERIAEMNEAFGNPKGDYNNIDFERIKRQCKNIFDEYLELMFALNLNAESLDAIRDVHAGFVQECDFLNPEHIEIEAVRDALCDIQVFASGAQHLMGVNADDDMMEVVGKVMSRFIKDDADKEATIAKHAAKGVTAVYFEGEYPKMVMKSAEDQPDAPKGKFLKSASFSEPVFPSPLLVNAMVGGSRNVEERRKAYTLASNAEEVREDVDEQGRNCYVLTYGDLDLYVAK